MPKVSSDLYSLVRSGKITVHHKSSSELKFWKNVNKEGPIHPMYGRCWVWTGQISHGYGRFVKDGKRIRAHRFSWKIHSGADPAMHVLHKCDNKACVNPDHLFLGTDNDNIQDMVTKERQNRGEDRPASKLTEDQVREIRRRFRKTSMWRGNGRQLAREFGVSKTAIAAIISGRNWGYLK
jgi:hypothetical protein